MNKEPGDERKGSRPDKGGFRETFTELGQAGHVKVAGKRNGVYPVRGPDGGSRKLYRGAAFA